MAVLRFGVYNEEGKLLGQRILPFSDLQVKKYLLLNNANSDNVLYVHTAGRLQAHLPEDRGQLSHVPPHVVLQH